MRFLHLSDLHFGKSLNGLSLVENGDQPIWVERFLSAAGHIKPDAVVIAGDVYDSGRPSGDAVQLLDRLLTGISELQIPVLMIAGNHDSGQKLSFVKDILSREEVHIAGTLKKKLTSVTLRDEHGPVTFWLLPYFFPALVSQIYGTEPLHDYEKAALRLLAEQDIDPTVRNVLVAHQNVTVSGEELPRGGSETMVGGVGQIDRLTFDAFDYVALGHIHAAYPVGSERIRYCGTPLVYHFNELRQQKKGPLLVELGEKGPDGKASLNVTTIEIEPLHVMREFRGPLEELRERLEQDKGKEEYVRIVLTDRANDPGISEFFREILWHRGSVLMEIVSEYEEPRMAVYGGNAQEARQKPVAELFEEFFEERTLSSGLTEEERDILEKAGELQLAALELGSGTPGEKDIQELLAFVLAQEEV